MDDDEINDEDADAINAVLWNECKYYNMVVERNCLGFVLIETV